MPGRRKIESDGLTHSPPGSVDEESEDSFPASDPPSNSVTRIGTPKGGKATPQAVKKPVANKKKRK